MTAEYLEKSHISEHLPRLFDGHEVTVIKEEFYNLGASYGLFATTISSRSEMTRQNRALFKLLNISDVDFQLQLFYSFPGQSPLHSEVFHFVFEPEFFAQFSSELLMEAEPFRQGLSQLIEFEPCAKSLNFVEQIFELTKEKVDFSQNLIVQSTIFQLLKRTLDLVTFPFQICQVPACKFLAFSSEREKITEAKAILENNIGQTISIKELSKMVAMNECYLKKGFKTLVGKSINEYQQDLRIQEARRLLESGSQTVTEVSLTLGYSSISHFSTAFKKATGLKPCMLLK